MLSAGLLLRLFHLLYNCDVVEEEVYHSWKEDIAQDFPGKEKALFQVREDREVVRDGRVESGKEGDLRILAGLGELYMYYVGVLSFLFYYITFVLLYYVCIACVNALYVGV